MQDQHDPDSDRSDESEPNTTEVTAFQDNLSLTARFTVIDARTEREAKTVAQRLFEEHHDMTTVSTLAERDEQNPSQWEVVIMTSHPQGRDGVYEIPADPNVLHPDPDGLSSTPPEPEAEAKSTEPGATTDESDAPEGWSELGRDADNTFFGQFVGGFRHDEDDVVVKVWEAMTAEWGYQFPDEDSYQTEDPRYYVELVVECENERDIVAKTDRGFEGDKTGAFEQAKQFAAEYTPDSEADTNGASTDE